MLVVVGNQAAEERQPAQTGGILRRKSAVAFHPVGGIDPVVLIAVKLIINSTQGNNRQTAEGTGPVKTERLQKQAATRLQNAAAGRRNTGLIWRQ